MDGTAPGDILSTMINTPENLGRALVKEANKWVGVHESGGNNKGPEVERFQKCVDGKASQEAWCMAFAQFCISQVEHNENVRSKVARSEHCLTVWHDTPAHLKGEKPIAGALVIWRHGDSYSGHAGIVTEVLNELWFNSVEGNTSPAAGSSVVREGDGVYKKLRSINGSGDMAVVGFVYPWA